MDHNQKTQQEPILKAYAHGLAGTRETIQKLGYYDYADLLIALAEHDLGLPKPSITPEHAAHLGRASALLQPLLLNGR